MDVKISMDYDDVEYTITCQIFGSYRKETRLSPEEFPECEVVDVVDENGIIAHTDIYDHFSQSEEVEEKAFAEASEQAEADMLDRAEYQRDMRMDR